MLERGWVEEVKTLVEKGYQPSLPPFRAIGYHEITEHLNHPEDLDTLKEKIAQRTRQYAKRQMTWFRKHPDIFWVSPGQEAQIVEQVEIFLKTDE